MEFLYLLGLILFSVVVGISVLYLQENEEEHNEELMIMRHLKAQKISLSMGIKKKFGSKNKIDLKKK